MVKINFSDISQVKFDNLNLSRINLNGNGVWKRINKPAIENTEIEGKNIKFSIRNNNDFNMQFKYCQNDGHWIEAGQINANMSKAIKIAIPNGSKGAQLQIYFCL